MFVPLLALAMLAGHPAPTPSRALKNSDLRGLFSQKDYPLEARLNHWEGTVVMDLIVNPAGKVIKCHVVETSGHPLLDNQTCWIFTNRARYRPDMDASGHPVQTILRTPPVTWRDF
jgi:protein TonB